MKFSGIIIISACCLSLTSCFTGIESTPRITAKDVDRVVPPVNEEADFAAQLAPPGMTQWESGRRFLVTDPKLSLLFEKEPAIAPGDVLVFDRLDDEISITGDTVSVLSFHKENGNATDETLRYKIGVPSSSLSASVTLPMSVDLDMTDNARRILAGKKFYIISPLRVDSELTPVARGRRYVGVTIRDVAPGNADYPLRVDITDDLGNQSSVAMTVGNARSSTRNFDKLFELSDPRLRYPTITDTAWENIVNSRVAPGMTTVECHLALGAPRDVRKWHNGGSFFESWTCDNGAYLIFIDGLLAEIH